MEFDLASKRLQREQQRSKQSTMKKKNMSMNTQLHTTKDMLLQQKQQRQKLEEQRHKERQQKLYEIQLLNAYMQKYDSKLHIQSLVSPAQTSPPFQPPLPTLPPSKQHQVQPQRHLTLIPVSIHGNGDKITLPPSILERLLQQQESAVGHGNESQPWTFRIGIRNPIALANPISNELQIYVQENFRKSDAIDSDEGDDDEDDDDDEDEDAMDVDANTNTVVTRNRHWRKKEFLNDMTYYMKELQQHQYISYTHGTVIEFTQEEGYIGIPLTIANALLQPSSKTNSSKSTDIERTRAVDPAAAASAVVPILSEKTSDGTTMINDVDEEKTPGHVAYNAFDVPAVPIEIVLLQLPKGTGMTLRPIIHTDNTTKSFYELQQDQVKYALEQSIQRTRATITLYETLTTWYRGNEYQFLVTKLVVASSNSNGTNTNVYNAISCLNTDIEIDFEPMDTDDDTTTGNKDTTTTTSSNSVVPHHTTKTTGRRLMDEPVTATPPAAPQQDHTTTKINHPNHIPRSPLVTETMKLAPEPLMEEKNNVITIQFRWSSHNRIPTGSPIQRRFDISTTTIRDLFTFVQQQSIHAATTEINTSQQQQLVRRYPRRIFTNNDDSLTLLEAGFQIGNELLIVEDV
jgi:UBX domain